MALIDIEVRTKRGALVASFKRYLKSLDLVFQEYPPTQYVIIVGA